MFGLVVAVARAIAPFFGRVAVPDAVVPTAIVSEKEDPDLQDLTAAEELHIALAEAAWDNAAIGRELERRYIGNEGSPDLDAAIARQDAIANAAFHANKERRNAEARGDFRPRRR